MESAAGYSSEPLPPIEEPAPSTAVDEAPQISVPAPIILEPFNSAGMGSEVVVAEVEQALVKLLCCYKDALKFAADMPVFGRSEVSGARFRVALGRSVLYPGVRGDARTQASAGDPVAVAAGASGDDGVEG
jgi:hypothetical protein